MSQYLIMCRSLTYAQRAASLLEGRGIRASVVKAPQSLTGKGCGYALRLYRSIDHARVILSRAQLLQGDIYIRRDDGAYERL